MDVEIYSQIALGLPLTTMQASSRHPSHRARRCLLGHSSICVSFRIVCHPGACRATDLLPNKVAGSIHVFSTLFSPGNFQVGTSPALPRLTVDRPWRFSFSRARQQIRFPTSGLLSQAANIYLAFGESLSTLPNANANGSFTSINGID